MNQPEGTSAIVDALRLGLDPKRVQRFATEFTLYPETMTVRAPEDQESPLLICLHPPRLTEFQFAQRMRELSRLSAHLAFPRGLHAHEVDLGGARTVGYAWCHYTGDNPAFRESLATASTYLQRILVRLLEDLPVDRRAIYLLGAEGGALTAAVCGVSQSDAVAGVITIGGRILPEVLADHLPEKRRIPFLCIHSRRGRNLATADTRKHIADLRDMGFPVDFELLRGDAEPWHDEENLVLSWLSQKAGVPVLEAD
jgi:predicted esterase